jgi:hypothetical protein
MTFFDASIAALFAILLAVLLERLLRQYYRKLKDDCSRIEAAQNALKSQKQLVDHILDNEAISLSIKTFVIELSEVIPEQKMAYRIAEWTKHGMPETKVDEKIEKEADELFDELRLLSKSNQEAFELVVSAFRGAFVTTMLQWPTTARCMQRLSYKIAVESNSEVAKSAAAVHRASRVNHWIDPLPA